MVVQAHLSGALDVDVDELHFAAVERLEVRLELVGRALVDLDDAEHGRLQVKVYHELSSSMLVFLLLLLLLLGGTDLADDALGVVGGAQQGGHHLGQDLHRVLLGPLFDEPRQRLDGRVVLRIVVRDGVLQDAHQLVQRQHRRQRFGAALRRTHHLVGHKRK